MAERNPHLIEKTLSGFRRQFGDTQSVRIFRAPGRINTIGEHVDYLGGIVLPAAIDYYIVAAIRKNGTRSYRMYSENYLSFLETQEILKSDKNPWVNYILGVVNEFLDRGWDVPGFDLVIFGDIPAGSGLSSSAALEVVTGFALNEIFGFGLDRTQIALIGQKAENEFVGTKCGIMDQFVICHGKENKCLSLDTSTLEFEYHEFHTGNWEFFLIQSNVKHSLNTSEYNQRRRECESALEKIRSYRKAHDLTDLPNLYSLEWNADLTPYGLTIEEMRRVRHVQSEKERTRNVILGLEKGDWVTVGSALTECHWSLSADFQVSCPETDFLVETLVDRGAWGSRMIGGGFGGCVLGLAEKGWIHSVWKDLEKDYQEKFGIPADLLEFRIADGVGEL